MPDVIDSFKGEYAFLSNFYMGGGVLPSVEHQFQALKTEDAWQAVYVMGAPTPKDAKRRGRSVTLRNNWETTRNTIMYALVTQKFEGDEELAEKLIATGDAELVEGNWWGDTYWGVCRGKGENKLGKILMDVREQIRASR
jgi:ribA/ribD-fused uncharacterized protein